MAQVDLRPGEWTTVRLPGLGTVGYSWTARVSGDTGAVEVEIGGAPADEIDGRPIGTSVDEIATIVARGPGRATVRLEQRRVWDPTSDPHDSRVIQVVVG